MMMQPPTTSPYAPPPAAQDPRQALPPNFVPHFNGINPNYPGVRAISFDPPLFCVDNFLTPQECQFLIHAASDSFSPAPVVGKGAGEISPSRTSSTCYLAKEDLPDLLRKVSALTGKPVEHCELPQVGRYLSTQQYFQHFDAFNLDEEDGRRFALNGGQRTVTVLVYLNNVEKGGHTSFPVLNLSVQPKEGMALVFFSRHHRWHPGQTYLARRLASDRYQIRVSDMDPAIQLLRTTFQEIATHYGTTLWSVSK